MSWIITGTEKTPIDPYFSNVSLLLHGDGTNGSTTIVDSSPTPKTVTAVGNAQISTTQSKFGGASIAFDGDGDYLISGPNAHFAMGLEDFTWETWVHPTSAPFFCTICSTRTAQVTPNGLTLGMDASRRLYLFSSGFLLNPAVALALNTWQYVAAVRSSGNLQLFLNGTSIGVTSNSQNFSNSSFAVGSVLPLSSGGQHWYGYIDDFRITKGVARYTSNFTPPTAPFPDF